MKYTKKVAVILLAALFLMTSCKINNNNSKFKIVTTIFPIYDWTKEIIAGDEDTDLILLTDNGVDIHSFQPTTEDIINVTTCDVLIYVGGESDGWIEDALKNKANENMVVINLSEELKEHMVLEETKEGMEAEAEEVEEEEEEYDEHIFLSLKKAILSCDLITSKLCSADTENTALYKDNCSKYIEKLSKLDTDFEQQITDASTNTLLFGDRFPFRYFTEDYSLDYYAAFKGCSSETQCSFDTITFLADKADELNLEYIFVMENSDEKLAESIIDNTTNKNMEILRLDSMQCVNINDSSNIKSYEEVMKSNMDLILKAIK